MERSIAVLPVHHRRISELSGLVHTCFPLPGQPAARLFIFHTGIWCDLQRDINSGRSHQHQPDSGVDHGQPGHGTGQLSTFRLGPYRVCSDNML